MYKKTPKTLPVGASSSRSWLQKYPEIFQVSGQPVPKVLISDMLLRHGNILKLAICDTSKARQRECHPPCFGWRQISKDDMGVHE